MFALVPEGTTFAVAGSLWACADDPLDVRESGFTENRVTAIGRAVDAAGAGIVNTDMHTLHSTDVSNEAWRQLEQPGIGRPGRHRPHP